MSTNVLSVKNPMTSSFSYPHSSSFIINQSSIGIGIGIKEKNKLQLILGIVVCSIGIAIFMAPETPQQFASICQKYNTTHACQVW